MSYQYTEPIERNTSGCILGILFLTAFWGGVWLLASMLLGCEQDDNSGVIHCPEDIRAVCVAAKESARVKITGRGFILSNEPTVTVERMSGIIYQDPQHGPVYGTYRGITVGSNPTTGAVIDGVIEHEFAHYWLVNNGYGYGHPTVLADLFDGWMEVE